MWKWTCPLAPKVEMEFHSWEALDESLTAHENGIDIPGVLSIKRCKQIHDFWDDGERCSLRNCKIPYIPESEDHVV